MLSGYLRFYERDVPVGTEYVIVREQLLTGQTDMDKVLERLKVLIDSSTPIVVMETVEEVRAVRMVRAACSALNLAVFEWTIATGLARCGTNSSNAIEAGAFDPGGLDAMAENLRGLTEEESERAISHALVTRYALCPETVTDVLEAKKALLKRSEMLDFVEVSDTLASVGGLDNLKRFLAQRRGSWEEQARAFGLDPPRGVIILGVQGCGKSMCARAIAGEWKLPLVKFDTAAVYDKCIGETEKRIQKVFQVAEGLAPCVLWIDELEKVFAGSGPDSASADARVSSRLLPAFFSW